MQFKIGHSYLYIIKWYMAFFLVMFAAGFVGMERLGIFAVAITLPALQIFLVISELRSGILLDGWWIARYTREWPYYRLVVAFQIACVVGTLVVASLIVTGLFDVAVSAEL